MKLDNQTHWRSDHLRAIALRVAKDELDAGKIKGVTMRVRYSRNSAHDPFVGGHAAYHSRSFQINLPSKVQPSKVDLAATMAHEMGHMRGMRHRDMRGSVRYAFAPGWRELYAWAAEYPLEVAQPKARPKGEERDERKLDHARKMLARKERALKRTEKLVLKWRRKVGYYTNKLARAAVQHEVQR